MPCSLLYIMIIMDNLLLAFGLTLFAGLCTGLGGLFAFTKQTQTKKFLSFALGLSAGVMIYVSFIDIFPKALVAISSGFGDDLAYFWTTLAFFLGMGLIALIDNLIPKELNIHELPGQDVRKQSNEQNLLRLGTFTAVAIAIHNFPEGLAIFLATLQNPSIGISIAFAIAIHNIPEGIVVAIPIFHATKSKRKAFLWSFISGLAEPLGAVIGFLLLRDFFNDLTFGFLFAGVAGIMVYISLDELLPAAEKYGEHHLSIFGVMSGMAIMALSLILL